MRAGFNAATRMALHRIGARYQDKTEDTLLGRPASASPTMWMVEDGTLDIEDAMIRFGADDPDERRDDDRVANKLRELANSGVQLNADGEPVLNGRRCCFILSEDLNTKMHRLALPSEHVCEECGTRWRVEIRVREERHHGR